MTGPPQTPGGTALALPGETPPSASEDRSFASAMPLPRDVYARAAEAAVPRMLQILGVAPWIHAAVVGRGSSRVAPGRLLRRQAATLAVGLSCEFGDARLDRAYLHEVVRTSLLRWQLTLRGDGRPARSRAQGSLYGAILAYIVTLLTETSQFQTKQLLEDIERHLSWLVRRRPASPWVEAATVGALADAALLVRDQTLHLRARDRLGPLLARQDPEGWFPEEGGPDVGRLSLTLDALARTHRQTGWEELIEPLKRIAGFLTHLVHPDDTVGGCYSSRGTDFLSPYGVELLAPLSQEAAALALCGRRRAAGLLSCDDDRAAVGSAGAALAQTVARDGSLDAVSLPHHRVGVVQFPRAALSIVKTSSYHAVVNAKRGGAIHVAWKNGVEELADPGVTVVYPLRLRSSSRLDRRTHVVIDDSSIRSSGILRGMRRRPALTWLRWLVSLFWRKRSSPPAGEPGANDPSGLAHDTFVRDIHFGEDWIRIRDRIHCRLPCRTIICQSPSRTRNELFAEGAGERSPSRPPIYIEGGRNVQITRVYRQGRLVEGNR